jgi:hypothetical protein
LEGTLRRSKGIVETLDGHPVTRPEWSQAVPVKS